MIIHGIPASSRLYGIPVSSRLYGRRVGATFLPTFLLLLIPNLEQVSSLHWCPTRAAAGAETGLPLGLKEDLLVGMIL